MPELQQQQQEQYHSARQKRDWKIV